MSRRVALTVAVAVLVAAGTVTAVLVRARHSGSASAPSHPNVLIIVTDDQREGLEVMPNTRRWFVQGGTSYPSAMVTDPLCCPSRASIMTGRYPHNHGVLTNRGGDSLGLDQGTTLQSYLHRAGYRTGLLGKYLNGWPLERPPPWFDEWAMFTRSGYPGAYTGGDWNVEGKVQPIETYSTSYLADSATRFITRTAGRPWFLYVATAAPHLPAIPDPAHARLLVPRWGGDPAVGEQDRSDKPAYVRRTDRGLATGTEVRTKQFRTLMSVDDMVGRVFSALASTGQLEHTLAFFLSDNGYLWGEHGILGKEAPYLPSLQVPFLARWPGHLAEGVADRRLVANIDIAPTVMAAAGLSAKPSMDGRSLLDPSWKRARLLGEFWHVGRVPTWATVVTPRFQFVEYYAEDATRVTFREYYDLQVDPWELVNLLGPHPGSNRPDVASLHALLARDRACRGLTCP